MAKTFEVGLRLALKHVHKYIGKYQPQLQANLTGPQYTALVSFLSCLLALLAALGEPTIGE